MRARDLDRYMDVPYCEATFDCADLVERVQREMFGRRVALPTVRPRGRVGSAALAAGARELAHRTDTPSDGDLVLMFDHGQHRAGHAGVWFWLDHEAWVLHTSERLTRSVLHRLRELPQWGLRLEGVYAWA